MGKMKKATKLPGEKKTKTSAKKKMVSPFLQLPHTDGTNVWKTTTEGSYVLSRLLKPDGTLAKVDCVGIDIGKKHTGVCGFDCTSLTEDKWPKVTTIALVSGIHKVAHDACDVLDSLFSTDKNFEWLRESRSVFIEQQLPHNPQAKQVAQAIRTNQRTIRHLQGRTPEVEFVGGQSKYDVGPLVAPDCANDEIRSEDNTGHANKPLRKLLGERDAFQILKHTKQSESLAMIASVCRDVDQLHDITDAMLIGLAGEVIKSSRGVKKRKTCMYGTGQKFAPQRRKKLETKISHDLIEQDVEPFHVKKQMYSRMRQFTK